ncbi:hypothetical protein J1605_009869 [Eschrichtius robustus]|uniref:Uncharacterized protein n=1 Tax=Eschrichtius robustus TaxID=9764 RepID=A0AB34GUH6_ESCRO|nr:hypothetical protein J1605_009869 [Eschrichtius robustus]
MDLQATSSNGKDEKCVAGRGACVLLGIQSKGSSECLVLRMLEAMKISEVQKKQLLKTHLWDFLVAQWSRIRLPMQGTQVRSLVQEDPTCRGATRSVRHNY